MVMICYTVFVMMLTAWMLLVSLKAAAKPSKIPDIFAPYVDDELAMARFLVTLIAAILELLFVAMLIVLGIDLADPVLKEAIIVLAVINTVSIFLTARVIRHGIYRKRWYLVVTSAYTALELFVVAWVFIYRLGGIM